MSAKILSTGSYIPPTKVSNNDLEIILDTNDSWIKERTGISSRHYEASSSVNMALNASKEALKNIDKESIDCVLVGTYTPDNLIPNVASSVREALGIKKNIPAFDINAACSGFIFTLHTARAFLKASIYKRILVIGVDFNSRTLDFSDRSSTILFGDGAGALVLEKSDNLFDSIIHSASDTDLSLTLPSSTDFHNPFIKRKQIDYPYFKMNGKEVFKFAVKAMRDSILEILDKHKLTLDDVDYVVAHQANERIIMSAAKMLKADTSKFLMNIDRVGNTSSGSIPILLDEENKKGTFKKGMKVIMVAFGGGLSYGSSLINWT
ncbi:MAG TPA: beta-ketoacyl-ACP synthase III [Erysipelothrix sp.]|nr:beta-ketoacyl-ACP synthase III [Erysipelothrix sp.]